MPDAEPADSGIEGVPVPAPAEAAEQDGGWRVPGMGYEELVAWYRDEMPEGEDLGPWDWHVQQC